MNEHNQSIGTLNEKHLHAALKAWYAQPGDSLEVPVDGYVIDVIQNGVLIEIQTGNFSSLKGKLSKLTAHHPVRLVYPIAQEKWILKRSNDASGSSIRRKSPKRGRVSDIFAQLVSFPELILEGNFSIEVLMTWEEEIRRFVKGRAWRRRGWVTIERRLLEVVERHRFDGRSDLMRLLPGELPDRFTTTELARTLKVSRRLAQQTAYCLRKMGGLEAVGKQNRSILYQRLPAR
jgi:hypothetical protein